MKKSSNHNQTIVKQLTLQAKPFSELPGHSQSMQMLIDLSGVSRKDDVLDVACGPGIVACEFSKYPNRVSGIDITPQMISQAMERQNKNSLINIDWKVGDVTDLPYNDTMFSIVLTRYSFHHFLHPKSVLNEMIRVCKPGGTVMVIDVVQPPEKAEKYDRLEIIRDPSHVHALSTVEMGELFNQSGLIEMKTAMYKADFELNAQLLASFPNPGDELNNHRLKPVGLNYGLKVRIRVA